MQNTLLHPDSTPKSSRQVTRQNSELLDTLTNPSKGILSEKENKSSELLENLNQVSVRKGKFSHLMNGTIEDWKKEFDNHPEWQGLSTEGLQKRIEEGGNAFCLAFLKWRKNHVKDIKDKGERITEEKRLKNIIFPDKQEDRSALVTIEDWKNEFDKHPEWQGLSTPEICKRKEDGGSAFFRAFITWKKKQIAGIEDKEERKREDSRLKNILFPDKYIDRSTIETIEDWKVEFDKHQEFRKLSVTQLEKREGGKAFYGAFLRWRANKVKDIENKGEKIKEEKRLKNLLFSDKQQDRSALVTIEDWKKEFDKHPEWQGLGTQKVKNRRNDGGLSFYSGFLKWRKNHVKDIKDKGERITEEKRLKNIIFPDKQEDRSALVTIEDWKNEFDKHPEWQGLSTKKMSKAFYQAFTTWKKKQVEGIVDKGERIKEEKRLKNIIFPDKYTRLKFTTVQDWKREFDKHPEWQGLSTEESTKYTKDKNAFYQSFTKWKNKQTRHIKDHTKREEENKKLAMIVFPEIKTPLYYTFNNNKAAFDSAGERKCAMILHTLGLAPTFIEGENLHVRSNGKALNSLDFKIGSVFLEYHPAQRHKTFAEGAQKKYKHITNLHHKDQTELYVFDDIYELYDMIRENRTLIHHVPVENLHYLTHPDEFKLLVNQINKELVDYDTQNTKINNNNFISNNLTGAEINSKAA